MKLDKYHNLKLRLEIFKFEKSYSTLNRVLYYFSFLGNIFLIYFGYFFVKSVTNSIPQLFPFQDTFFTVFIGLFLAGYELTKRFALEQMCVSLFQIGKATTTLVIGCIICVALVAGSFYLSIKGAHRLVDKTEIITTSIDSLTQRRADSVAKYYNNEIAYYRAQPGRTKDDRLYRDSIVNVLANTRDAKVQETEVTVEKRVAVKKDLNDENSTAFLFITVFLELLILLGVGFNAYYTVGSFAETGKLLQTPKFRQLDLNLRLLKLYYQNGKKAIGDPVLSYNKFRILVEAQNVNCTHKDTASFITLCQELEIVKSQRDKKYEFAMNYQQAKELIENQDIV